MPMFIAKMTDEPHSFVGCNWQPISFLEFTCSQSIWPKFEGTWPSCLKMEWQDHPTYFCFFCVFWAWFETKLSGALESLEHEFYDFPNSWDDDPIWLYIIFFRGIGQPPTRLYTYIYIYQSSTYFQRVINSYASLPKHAVSSFLFWPIHRQKMVVDVGFLRGHDVN